MKIIRPFDVTPAALTSSSVPETDYAAWSAATTYALGARVIVVADHMIYESLQATNLNHTPSTSPTWWLAVGATNRWKMFDNMLTSQTSNTNSIVVTIATTGRNDSVALLNVSAATARFVMTDAVEGVVYDKTYSLISTDGVGDWYSYFFEPIVRKTDIVELEMPPYANAALTITLTDTGSTVLCGACVVGQKRDIGGTQYGAKVGIQDYSIKTKDAYGNYSILERAFNKRATFTVQISGSMVDQLQTMLASYRAIPIVYVGSELYGSSIVYGFYKDFTVDIAYATTSICSIDLEGLT